MRESSLRYIVVALIVFTSVALSPHSFADYTTMIDTGLSSNRVDMVFLGDGYTASEINTTYINHIDNILQHIFDENEDPFQRYKNFFNIHRIDIISNESGADIPPQGIFRDTALDARYYFDGITERLLGVDYTSTRDATDAALADATFTAEAHLVTVNHTNYGGSGGEFAVFAGGNSLAGEIALHELGHMFSNLGDEYGGYPSSYMGPEPTNANATTSPSGDKWAHWIGYDQPGVGVIGAYEGTLLFDYDVYRPSSTSKMSVLDAPFNVVCREKIILDIYEFVDPLDAWCQNDQPLLDPDSLWVDVVDTDVIDIQWYVDDQLVPDAINEQFTITDYDYLPGTHTVTARAFDPTDWVRINTEMLEQFITWQIELTGDAYHIRHGDFNLDGFVDQADFTTWVDYSGQIGDDLPADGNFDNIVDHADFTVWADHYGQVISTGGDTCSIPEPCSFALLCSVFLLVSQRRTRRH